VHDHGDWRDVARHHTALGQNGILKVDKLLFHRF
jgi:hypothetical protein